VNLDEYKALASVDYITLMAPRDADITTWFRDTHRQWQRSRHHTLGEVIPLPRPGMSLPLSALYEGIDSGEQGRLRPRRPGR
jgi:hypothetical protein